MEYQASYDEISSTRLRWRRIDLEGPGGIGLDKLHNANAWFLLLFCRHSFLKYLPRLCLANVYTRGFSHFVTSMTAPIASGWNENCRWDSHPLENAALARRTPTPDIRYGLLNGHKQGFNVVFRDAYLER